MKAQAKVGCERNPQQCRDFRKRRQELTKRWERLTQAERTRAEVVCLKVETETGLAAKR